MSLSFGGGSTDTTENRNGTRNSTSTVSLPPWLQGTIKDYFGQVGGLMGQDPTGPSGLQQQSWAGGANLTGNAGIGQGMQGLQGLLNFHSGGVKPLNRDDVTKGLNKFMNPYTGAVIDRSLANLHQFGDQRLTAGKADATLNNSYGGSRHAVENVLKESELMRNAGDLSANLWRDNYTQALAGRTGEVERDQERRYYNNNLQNQNAQFRGDIAQGLLSGGLNADANSRANLITQNQLGQDQQNWSNPQMQQLAKISQLLGIDVNQLFGNNTNQNYNETSTGSEDSNEWGFDANWNSTSGFG